MKYNHNRTLEDFQEVLDIVRKNGYNPIGVSQIILEDTFIFETEDEAKRAYKQLEVDAIASNAVQAWWYSKSDFLAEVKDYEKTHGSKVLVYWI